MAKGGVFGNFNNPTISRASGVWSLREHELIVDTAWPGNTDPHFANVSLLLHGNGANASTTFTDSSSNIFTVTPSGSAQISTAQSKFGGASMLFDGTGDYLSIAFNADFDLIGSAFTVEAWIYPTISKAIGHRIFSTGGGTVGWNGTTGIHTLFQIQNATGNLSLQISNNTGTQINTLTTGAITINTWTHVAAVYNGGTNVRIFINGTPESFTIGTPARPTTNPSAAVATIPGEAGGNSAAFQGYIDDLRVTKGVARYTDTFIPPIRPFPDSA